MTFGRLNGVEDNQSDIRNIALFVEPLLPSTKKRLIAVLHLKTGHTTRWVKEEVIEPLIEAGYVNYDGETVSSNGNLSIGSKNVSSEKKKLPKPKKELPAKEETPDLHVNADGSVVHVSEVIQKEEKPTDSKGNHYETELEAREADAHHEERNKV